MIGSILFFLLVMLLLIGLSIPLMRSKVKPNSWYGLRIRATIDNPEVWYPANAYTGRVLFILGIVGVAASLLGPLAPGITADTYALLMSGILLIGALLMLVLGIRKANSLTK